MTNDYLMYGFWEKVEEIDTRIEQELEDEIRTVKHPAPVYEPVAKAPPQVVEETEYTGKRQHHYKRWRQKLGLVEV